MTLIIGNVVRVDVDGRSPWAIEALRSFGAVDGAGGSPPHLRVEFVDDVATGGLRELEPGVLIGRDVLVDETYGVRIGGSEDGALVLATDRSAVEWLMWLLHVAALRAGAAFVHSAAVERDGDAVLFPSWGGVGKTALVSGFIKEYGWRLLGDDLVIVEGDGACHPFPKSMVLYPYHRSVFPQVFESGNGPVAPTFMNEWLSAAAIAVKPVLRKAPGLLAFARKHNPQSTRISPTDVFGAPAISTGGAARATVWLERLAGINEPEVAPAGDTLISRIIGSTTNEYDPRCVRLTNVAMGLGMLHLDAYWSGWRQTLEQALGDKPQYLLYLPVSMPVSDVPGAVREMLETVGLWEGGGVAA